MLNFLDLIKNSDFVPIAGIIALYLFLPLTALSYILFRHYRRMIEIKRVFEILEIKEDYREAYTDRKPSLYLNFILAMVCISVLSLAGLGLLLLGHHLNFSRFTWRIGDTDFPVPGSRLIVGMAFLGAYVWSIQDIFRRYSRNDLRPSVYYRLSVRMILASITALVFFHAYEALSGGNQNSGGITAQIWPAIAFFIGMFPRRALNWLMRRIPIFASAHDPSVPEAHLEMIEGITIHDIIRLEELGIDNAYDLASADFVPLFLRTSYGSRQLVDWILQAKLCIHFSSSIKELRENGIRTALDLKNNDSDRIDALASEIALSKNSLQLAKKSIEEDEEINRLCRISQLLSKFSPRKVPHVHKSSPPTG